MPLPLSALADAPTQRHGLWKTRVYGPLALLRPLRLRRRLQAAPGHSGGIVAVYARTPAQPEPLLYAAMSAQPESQVLSIRSLIARELQQVALEHGRTLAPLTDEIKLLELGLDSLGLAVVVIRLADSLGIDPFGSGKSAAPPVTFGEFVAMYESLRD
jgi:hypothetical protein